MDQVLKKISSADLRRVYVVHGSDRYLVNQVYKALQQRALAKGFSDWNWVTIAGSKELDAVSVIQELSTTPWDGGTKIVAITECELVPAAEWDSIVDWLEKNLYGNTLALFFDKLDKRLKSIKAFIKLGEEIRCQHLTGQTLVRWVQDYVRMKGYQMRSDVVERFLELVGDDLNFITTECAKLFVYVGQEQQEISMSDVEEITSITPDQLENGEIFKMVDAISAKNLAEAMRILHRLIDAGEPALRILPLIERQLRLLLAAKTKGSMSVTETAKAMGEKSDFALKKAFSYHQKFSEEQLYEGFSRVIAADRELKLGASGEFVLERLISWMCT